MKVLWERPITKASRLLGVDDNAVYLGGDEFSAVDLQTRKLLWATRVPNGSMDGRVLVRPDGLWQLTPRGIFEIDPKSGDVRRIFRGNDLGAVGGDLLLTDRWLLAVSNRTISAYPRRAPGTDVSARDDSASHTRSRLAMNKPAIAAHLPRRSSLAGAGPPGPGSVLRPDGELGGRSRPISRASPSPARASSRPSPTSWRSTWRWSPPPS